MNCISSRHACFYGDLVDTYKIPSIQSVVYSDKYQSTEENNCLKRKEECSKIKPITKMGLFCASKGGYPSFFFTKFILNFRLQFAFQIHLSPFSMSFIRR